MVLDLVAVFIFRFIPTNFFKKKFQKGLIYRVRFVLLFNDNTS